MMPTPAPDDFVTTALASLAATLPTARLWAAVAPQEPAGQGTRADCIATQFALLQAAESDVASWPPSRLEPQARSCEREGLTLFQQASGLQQLLIRRSAQRLLERELARLSAP